MNQKTTIGSQISALFGSSAIYVSCGMGGGRRQVKEDEIASIQVLHGTEPISGRKVDSPVFTKMKDGTIAIGSTGSCAVGDAGNLLSFDEVTMASLGHLLGIEGVDISYQGKKLSI